jgi:hypothetical protein
MTENKQLKVLTYMHKMETEENIMAYHAALAYPRTFFGEGGLHKEFFFFRGVQRIQLRTGQREWGSGGSSP